MTLKAVLNAFDEEPNNNWSSIVMAKPDATDVIVSSNVLKLTVASAFGLCVLNIIATFGQYLE